MAKDNISDRGMKALFSLKSAIDREYLSVFTSLKLFDHTVKQVCLYGSEIWSEFEKDTGSLSPYEFIEKWFKKSMIEKVNMSFSKWLLGVHKRTSNLAVMGELGRYPLFIDTIVRTVSYWANLQKRRFKKPLLNDCLKLSENLHNNGSTSWISGINKILQKNPLTGDFSCPEDYEAVLVDRGSRSARESRRSCHRSWFHNRCSIYFVWGSANYASYWCVARGSVHQQSGFQFGGLYTDTVPNLLTGSKSCPLFYYPLKMG
ncbi:hypothetical protein FSP39_023694 [Pinctada imbricata]|uniref:Uncharacterized protein n=1 Tax=Pinctada imbricata TaxID=66713 RepID=A0AA88YPR6_PINIB|nr:hypothetical protein FSP39_023694 [Pinctada imbricata]